MNDKRLLTCIVLCVLAHASRANDSFFVVDLVATNNQFVESAPVQIPAGYDVGFRFIPGNEVASAAFYQGVKIETPQIKFIVTDVPDGLPIPPSPFSDAPRFSVQNFVPTVFGPCKISAFASNAPARLQVYVFPSDSLRTRGLLLGTNTHQLQIPSGVISEIRTSGNLQVVTSYPTGLTTIGSYQDASRYKPYTTTTYQYNRLETNISVRHVTYSGGTISGPINANLSRVIDGFSFGYRISADVPRNIFGPAVVTFSNFANLNSSYGTNLFGVYEYWTVPANASYSAFGTTNSNNSTNTNSSPMRSFNLQLQRSTNLSDWETTDNYYINETASNAFYRLKPVAQ
jgi:hypothetical protein